jgi:hypothetical protein
MGIFSETLDKQYVTFRNIGQAVRDFQKYWASSMLFSEILDKQCVIFINTGQVACNFQKYWASRM